MSQGARRFRFVAAARGSDDDPRLPALAGAGREHRVVRVRAYEADERVIHPIGLVCDATAWAVEDELQPDAPVPLGACGHVNISSRTFAPRTTRAT